MSDRWTVLPKTGEYDYHFDAAWNLLGEYAAFTADVQRDGCVHLRRYWNDTPINLPPYQDGDVDYLHICDLDQMIEMLIELKTLATEHFGSWPI